MTESRDIVWTGIVVDERRRQMRALARARQSAREYGRPSLIIQQKSRGEWHDVAWGDAGHKAAHDAALEYIARHRLHSVS